MQIIGSKKIWVNVNWTVLSEVPWKYPCKSNKWNFDGITKVYHVEVMEWCHEEEQKEHVHWCASDIFSLSPTRFIAMQPTVAAVALIVARLEML
jgi:hypothetical protein